MPDRYRNQTERHTGGSHGRFDAGPPGVGTEFTARVNECSDIVGPGDNAPFLVTRFECEGGVINKPYTGFFSSWFNNYTCDYIQAMWSYVGHLGVDTMGSVEAATRGAARTNPSRPYIDLPVEIAQVHEIPEIIRNRADNEFARVGQANLAWQFGAEPVGQDVASLLNLTSQIGTRAQQLVNARRSGGMKRTIVVDAASNMESRDTFLQTDGVFIRDNVDWWTGETVKVHARWTPDEDYSSLTQSQLRHDAVRDAFRALTGGIIDYSTIWELIPYSWLVDYFGNVGEYFQAYRNIVGMTLSDVAVMRHTVTKGEWGGLKYSADFTMSPFTVRYETKRRVTSFIAPVLSSDSFLNSNQLGIIASLAATR